MQRFLLSSLLVLTLASCVRAQNTSVGEGPRFSAIFQFSDAEVRQVTSPGWEAFLGEHKRQNSAGFRLIDIESYKIGGDARQFVGVYTESPLPDSVGMANSWAEFIQLKRKMAKSGYTMSDITGVVLNESDVNFYGVWVKEANPKLHKVWLMDSQETVVKRTKAMARERFKIKRVHVLDIPNGEPAFIVLYHFSPIDRYNFLYFADDMATFNAELEARRSSQVQLIDFDRFRRGPDVRYVAIFQDGAYESSFLTAANKPMVDETVRTMEKTMGLKLVNLSVD